VRVGIGIALLAACSFHAPPALTDGAIDDVPLDVPVDMPMSQRVTTGLVGFWTFDDPSGTTNVMDTAGTSTPVPLHVETSATIFPPTLAGGTITADMSARLLSSLSTHLASDCLGAGAVSLEAWVKPQLAMQGDAGTPRFIAGIATNVVSRDVVLLQAGDKWIALVRTNGNAVGTPMLISQSHPDPTKFTHLVVVADQNQRTLYVDDIAEATDPMVGGPLGWDTTSSMALFQEPQGGRAWLGSIQIVAVYRHGLLPTEVDQNFQLGPAAL